MYLLVHLCGQICADNFKIFYDNNRIGWVDSLAPAFNVSDLLLAMQLKLSFILAMQQQNDIKW